MHIVRYFGNKRLVEYLENGMNILISFENHGMGDCVMFIPLYNRLKEIYPNVNFSLKCGPGQEIFNDINCDSFDYCFVIEFPEFYFKRDYGSFDGMSKPEICAVYELGITFDSSIEFTWHPDSICNSEINVGDNTIGVAFQVTSNPNKSISYDCAKVIWEMIKEYGYTPLEVHFEHGLGNPRNKKYDFIDNTCRNYEPNINNVISVINKCKGFVGVNTGTFCMATSMKNGNTLHMFKIFHFCPGYKKFNPVMEIDCRNVDFINKTIFEEYTRKIK